MSSNGNNNNNNVPEGSEETVNDIATQYIIPISVVVGVLLAILTIGCVCYRRWRFAIRVRQERALMNTSGTSHKKSPSKRNLAGKSGVNSSRRLNSNENENEASLKVESYNTEDALKSCRRNTSMDIPMEENKNVTDLRASAEPNSFDDGHSSKEDSQNLEDE